MTKQGTREPTRRLADFAARLRYDDLPERTREHCKNLILDALACALAGHQGEETNQVRALATALAQGKESSVIGGAPLSLVGAAFCEHPLGAFENPLSCAQVEQKFRLYAGGLLPDARIEEVIDAVRRLEAFGSVRELMALLCASPQTRAMAAAE